MNYTDIKEYITLSKDERQRHIDLTTSCVEIGGSSYNFKGMMAHLLKTTIPQKQDKIHLCHACNNAKCSSPQHLYWGTLSDNVRDSMSCGTWENPWDRAKKKYGADAAKKLWCATEKRKTNASVMGKQYGGWNRLTENRISKIEELLKHVDVLKYGWVQKLANELGVSHTQVKRYLKKYFPDVKVFERK